MRLGPTPIFPLSLANVPEDEFGQAYEYLIKKFADDSGHTAAEFYTNRTLVHLMTLTLDPQLGEYPAASVVKAVSRKPIAEVDDKTLILADVGEKALVQVRESTRELLTRSQPPEKARELAELLATGTWTHDFPITVDVAQKLGLKVRSDMPAEFLQLMSLFPQPVRRQPSVEYIPTRRRAEQPSPPQNLA